MRKMIDGSAVEVTKDFLEYKEKQKWQVDHFCGLDYLLLEYDLIQKGEVEKGYDIVHDFIYDTMRIDVKEIQKYFNVATKNKLKWWSDSYDEGAFTHFLFVGSDREGPLKLGDVITYEYIGLWEVPDLMEMFVPSWKCPGGFYVPREMLREG